MTPVRWQRGLGSVLLCVFLIALAVRVVPASRIEHPTPDGVEYLAVAHEVAAGHGLRLPLRGFHIARGAPPWEVAHRADLERAPLWPLLLAPLWRCGGDVDGG